MFKWKVSRLVRKESKGKGKVKEAEGEEESLDLIENNEDRSVPYIF